MSEAAFPWSRLAGSRPRVLVIGDAMLDCTVQGEARRLSPEAPVPVIRQQEMVQSPGGAANVAVNLAGLGARVSLFGVIGDDAEGEVLRAALVARGVICDGLTVIRGRPTTLKTRLVSQRQQVARVDREVSTPLPPASARLVLSRLDQEIKLCGTVLVPDYGKGVITRAVWDEVTARTRKAGVPVRVDPHPHKPLEVYRGAEGIKLNWPEARQAVELASRAEIDIDVAGQHALRRTRAQWAIITRGEDGLAVFQPGRPRYDLPTRRREVFDVTGAGDTVFAALGFALAAGLEVKEAAQLANVAGGLVVERLGTASVTLEELELDMRPETELHRKLVDRAELMRCVAQHRQAGRRIVFTNGCFDLLHAGHIRLLRYCASLGEVVVVGLNTDESVRFLKGRERPFLPLDERATLLGALSEVSLIVPFGEETPEQIIAELCPDVLVKGADYKLEEVAGRQLVEAAGGRVVLAPLLENVSGSDIVRRIRNSTSRGSA